MPGTTLHQLRGLHALLSKPDFPTETIVVPTLAESHTYGLLDQLDPEARAVRPYIAPAMKTKPTTEEDKATNKGVMDWVDWRRRSIRQSIRGVRTEDEDLPWAPSKEQFGIATRRAFRMVSISSQSMAAEYENTNPKDGTPWLYQVTGVPLPMEWDYQSWHGDEQHADPILPLQHFIHDTELPDVLLLDDPDRLTLPTLSHQRPEPDASDDVESSTDSAHTPAPTHDKSDNASSSSATIFRSSLVRYRRVNPLRLGAAWSDVPPLAQPKPPVYLSLSSGKPIGDGNSARVWDGVIEFNRAAANSEAADAPGFENINSSTPTATAKITDNPIPISQCLSSHQSLAGAIIPDKLSVAVKVPYASSEAEDFVRNEAKIYTLLPDGLSRTYNGYTMPPRARGWTPQATSAICPKFYGYYVPEDTKADKHRKPILLMEKCGIPVPDRMSVPKKKSIRLTDEHK